MILKELVKIFDKEFHKDYSLNWDNSGLLIGDLKREIRKLIIALDANDAVISKAVKIKADLIFSHHPLILNPIKNITSDNPQSQAILKAAQNKIAVYCAHTNYDIMEGGLNDYIVRLLDLENIVCIIPNQIQWFKFVVYVPSGHEEKIRNAMCSAGGGQWKDYSCATFNTSGTGTFKPGSNSEPFIGEKGKLMFVDEVKIECIVREEILKSLIAYVLEVHPYEEPAYDIIPIENVFAEGGSGRVGSIKKSLKPNDFLQFVSKKLNISNFKYISKDNFSIIKNEIKNIAVINGSINSMVSEICSIDIDCLICGEVNYHNAQLISENNILVIELGHAESELFAIDDLFSKIEHISESMCLGLEIIKSNNKEILWRYIIGK
ncbi:MAG: Nif3-like dinuclear metal center hexameric protein [Candidatus Humimicrobiaceae bacterium]